MPGLGASSIQARLALLLLFVCPLISAREEAPDSAETADLIVVVKSIQTTTLYSGGTVLKTYRVALSRDPLGPKQRAGDQKYLRAST